MPFVREADREDRVGERKRWRGMGGVHMEANEKK